MKISAEAAKETYEYYSESGDRTYKMVAWSKREEQKIEQVIKEAERGLKIRLDVKGKDLDVEEGLAGQWECFRRVLRWLE